MNVLFVCSQNRLRSPTAEAIYAHREDLDVRSAGTNPDSEAPISLEDVEWADLILVMDASHRNKLQGMFGKIIASRRVHVLGIPDNYEYMQPELIEILRARIDPILRRS